MGVLDWLFGTNSKPNNNWGIPSKEQEQKKKDSKKVLDERIKQNEVERLEQKKLEENAIWRTLHSIYESRSKPPGWGGDLGFGDAASSAAGVFFPVLREHKTLASVSHLLKHDIITSFNGLDISATRYDFKRSGNKFADEYNIPDEEIVASRISDIDYWFNILIKRVEYDSVAAMYTYSNDAPGEEKLLKNLQGHFETYKQKYENSNDTTRDIYESMRVRILMFGYIYIRIKKMYCSSDKSKSVVGAAKFSRGKRTHSMRDIWIYQLVQASMKAGSSLIPTPFTPLPDDSELSKLAKEAKNQMKLILIHTKASLYSAIAFAMYNKISKKDIISWFPEFEEDLKSLKKIGIDWQPKHNIEDSVDEPVLAYNILFNTSVQKNFNYEETAADISIKKWQREGNDGSDDLIQGEAKEYYKSGELHTTANYVDGLKQGEWKAYYESGELKSTVNYVDDLKQGEIKGYYKSGELEYTNNFVDDLIQGEAKGYFKSGELNSTVNLVDNLMQGEWKQYDESGELKTTANFVDGLKHGEQKEYYESGELLSTANFVADIRHGEFKVYYESGELEYTVNFINNLRQGEHKKYYKSGELQFTVNFVDGVQQ